MKVAITGVASRIGAELVCRLEGDRRVERIVGLDVREPSQRSEKLQFVRRDVRDHAMTVDLQGCDVLAHLAFLYQPPLPSLEEVYATNVDGSRNVFDCAVRAGVNNIVFMSSVAAYGAFADNPVPITEEHPIRLMTPTFYYNDCKVRVERYLDQLEVEHPSLVVTRLRPCTVATRAFSHVLDRGLYVDASPRVPVQFVWVDDVVEALYLAIAKRTPGAFNIAGDHPRQWQEIAAMVGKRSLGVPHGLALPLARATYALHLQRRLPPGWLRMSRYSVVMDCTRAKELLGWTPRHDTAGAIAQYFAHQRRGEPGHRS